MENIPRQRGFFCASLKTTTITTALLVIFFTLYGMAQSVEVLVTMLDQESTLVQSGLTTSVLVAQIVAYIVTFFLSLMLLLGTLKSRLQLMKPWIVWFSLKMTAGVIIFIYVIALNTINAYTEPAVLLFYVAHFFKLLVQVYMLILVSSYYHQLEEGNGEAERHEDAHIHPFCYPVIC